MELKPVRRLANIVPPLVIDAALACILGGVGAAQLVSQRAPFQGPVRDQLHRLPAPGAPIGPGPGPGPGQGGDVFGFGPPQFHQADTLTYILLALCAASLLLRRRFPLLALAGVTAFAAAYLARGEQPFSVQLI